MAPPGTDFADIFVPPAWRAEADPVMTVLGYPGLCRMSLWAPRPAPGGEPPRRIAVGPERKWGPARFWWSSAPECIETPNVGLLANSGAVKLRALRAHFWARATRAPSLSLFARRAPSTADPPQTCNAGPRAHACAPRRPQVGQRWVCGWVVSSTSAPLCFWMRSLNESVGSCVCASLANWEMRQSS